APRYAAAPACYSLCGRRKAACNRSRSRTFLTRTAGRWNKVWGNFCYHRNRTPARNPLLLWLHAEVAGGALPPAAPVNPGVSKASAAPPRLALVHTLLVVGTGHNCGVAVGMHHHAGGLQSIGAVGLVFHRV